MGDSSIFTRRLKEARLRKGLSQEQLGILAGIDEFSASARMNQYERGKHVPDLSTITRIAVALGIPVAYLFADDDRLARLIEVYSSLSEEAQSQLQSVADQLAACPTTNR